MNKHPSIKISVVVTILILTVISVFVYTRIYRSNQSKNVAVTKVQTVNTETELYKEMLITALDPYIQKSVTSYYGKGVMAPPYMVKVIDAKRPTTDQTYELKFEVEPYIGAHNELGIDHVTLRISPTKIEVLSFEHIKSFPLPPNLQAN